MDDAVVHDGVRAALENEQCNDWMALRGENPTFQAMVAASIGGAPTWLCLTALR
jgi:hypothetical protein